MEEIWNKLTNELSLDQTSSQIWLERLKEKYNDSTRHYHTENQMLKSKLVYLDDQKPAVILAILFQYYEYDSKSNSAEMNCKAFNEFCKDTALSDNDLIQHVLKLLGDPSSTCVCDSLNDDLNFLQDLDLIYLGVSPPETYKTQIELLRKDYPHMNDKQYNSMRLKFLETFLNVLPCIYSTSKFRDLYEETAKKNVSNEVQELKQLRDTIHKLMNSSSNMFQDSPNAQGMYKRRNRRRSRNLRRIFQTSMNSNDDCIILPDKPPEIISLIDDESDQETTANNNKKDESLSNALSNLSPFKGNRKKKKNNRSLNHNEIVPSTSSMKRYPENEAYTPFFIDTKKEDTPVLQIPLYEVPKNDSIICLDDTITPNPSSTTETATEQISSEPQIKKYDTYESVLNDSQTIVIDDENMSQAEMTLEEGEIREDFIPLSTDNTKNEKAVFVKRLVIIDGNNIAMHHGNNKVFSVQGIEIAIKHFEDLGHEVKVIIPQFRMKLNKSSSQVLLEKLHGQGKILLTPCKNLPGQVSASYDDRFILEVAERCDAAIISNDNYKDLLKEKEEWKNIITSRVIGFMFCGDQIFVPNDPYGRHGPKLSEILNKKS
uniref:CSON009582 protein n=2 Tax=Culicoides sonorensis TaxID=179676 RepID=A0A336MYG1_CULSO